MNEDKLPQEFTNRELWMLIDKNNSTNILQHEVIIKSLDEYHASNKTMLNDIYTQTSKTNGRVTILEETTESFDLVRKIVYGGCSIILVGVLGALFKLIIIK